MEFTFHYFTLYIRKNVDFDVKFKYNGLLNISPIYINKRLLITEKPK